MQMHQVMTYAHDARILFRVGTILYVVPGNNIGSGGHSGSGCAGSTSAGDGSSSDDGVSRSGGVGWSWSGTCAGC